MSKLLYSTMVIGSDGLFHGSGILPIIKDGKPASKMFSEQTKEVFEKIKESLKERGLTFKNLLKVKVMLKTSMENFGQLNEIYTEIFEEVEVMPARECKAYADLPFGVLIEVSFIADPKKVK